MPKKSKKLQPGISAKCSVLIKFLHLVKVVQSKFPNFEHNKRLDNLFLLFEKEIRVNRIDQKCFVFRHADFANLQIHASKRWVEVEEEGPINSLFDPDTFVSSTNEEQVTTSGSDSDTIADRGEVFIFG